MPDLIELFEHVYDGIWLCEDCAMLPYKAVCKRQFLEWVDVDGDYYPKDSPIHKRSHKRSICN